MKIAYLILAHSDPNQLKRLVCALSVENKVSFFIHIDARQDIKCFKKEVSYLTNVFFIKEREEMYWAGNSICKAEKLLLKYALSSKTRFDRFVLLSGLDYPLWSNDKMRAFYKAHPNIVYMKGYNLSKVSVPKKVPQRIETYHFRDLPIENAKLRHYIIGGLMVLMNILPIHKRKYIEEYDRQLSIYAGSQWFNIPRDCAEYLFERMNDSNMCRYFSTSFAPDEMFVQTIIFNSKFLNNAIDCLEDGIYPGLEKITCTHYIEYEGGQKVFTLTDYDKLIKSGKMFCRKVQTGISNDLLNKIDEYRKNG